MQCTKSWVFLTCRLIGVLPFGKNAGVEQRIVHGELNKRHLIDLSRECQEFIYRGLTVDPKDRWTVDDVKKRCMSHDVDAAI